jgi:hypothetical protein
MVEYYKHANSHHLHLIVMDWVQCTEVSGFFNPLMDKLWHSKAKGFAL